jgi:hypothetical protein
VGVEPCSVRYCSVLLEYDAVSVGKWLPISRRNLAVSVFRSEQFKKRGLITV